MTMTANTENVKQYKRRFSLIAEEILDFAFITKLVREAKNMPPNFKRIA